MLSKSFASRFHDKTTMFKNIKDVVAIFKRLKILQGNLWIVPKPILLICFGRKIWILFWIILIKNIWKDPRDTGRVYTNGYNFLLLILHLTMNIWLWEALQSAFTISATGFCTSNKWLFSPPCWYIVLSETRKTWCVCSSSCYHTRPKIECAKECSLWTGKNDCTSSI